MQHRVSRPYVKGYKFPIYLTKEQEQYFAQVFGCCRYVWNRALQETEDAYAAYLKAKTQSSVPSAELLKPDLSGYAMCARLTTYKSQPELSWLYDVSAVALQQTMLHLSSAWSRYFKKYNPSNPGKGRPRKKRKYISKNSFSLMKTAFQIKDGYLYIAKCEVPIKVVYSRELPSDPSSLTISKTSSGKYYVSFTCAYAPNKTLGTGVIGIDLGLKSLATLSTGEVIKNPKYFVRSQKRLRRLNQSLARKQKGSQNRIKARLTVAKQHERVSNQRRDYHHQLSRRLINENQVIGLEDLRVRNMMANRKLSKAIGDVGWHQFRRFMVYKANESQHCTVVIAASVFPSTHLCSVTDQRLSRKLSLSERSWDCPYCGKVHDRDVNAALNLEKFAVRALAKYYDGRSSGETLVAEFP